MELVDACGPPIQISSLSWEINKKISNFPWFGKRIKSEDSSKAELQLEFRTFACNSFKTFDGNSHTYRKKASTQQITRTLRKTTQMNAKNKNIVDFNETVYKF